MGCCETTLDTSGNICVYHPQNMIRKRRHDPFEKKTSECIDLVLFKNRITYDACNCCSSCCDDNCCGCQGEIDFDNISSLTIQRQIIIETKDGRTIIAGPIEDKDSLERMRTAWNEYNSNKQNAPGIELMVNTVNNNASIPPTAPVHVVNNNAGQMMMVQLPDGRLVQAQVMPQVIPQAIPQAMQPYAPVQQPGRGEGEGQPQNGYTVQ